MVELYGKKSVWRKVLCLFGYGCHWLNKVRRNGECPERMCIRPGCHRRQVLKVTQVVRDGFHKPYVVKTEKWVTIKRERRRKGRMMRVK